MSRCVPGPINSCTVQFSADGQLAAHVRTHPQGGLREVCGTGDCDDTVGLSICLVGDPEPKAPSDPTESGLRMSPDGCLFIDTNSTRKRRVVSAGTQAGVGGFATLATTTLTIDAQLFTEETCWRVCVDVCSAFIDKPPGGNSTVSIPPADVPSTPSSHSHGTITVNEADPLFVSGGIEIDGSLCTTHAANRGQYAPYSGTVCREITVPPGVSYDITVSSIVDPSGSVGAGGFTASSGQMTIVAEKVACAEDC